MNGLLPRKPQISLVTKAGEDVWEQLISYQAQNNLSFTIFIPQEQSHY